MTRSHSPSDATRTSRFSRLAALVVACVMALAACGGGGGDSSASAKSITLWLSASTAQAAGYYTIAKDFKAKTGISVKIVNVPYDGFQTKLRQAAQANSLPDVGRVPSLDPIWTNKLEDISSIATSGSDKINKRLVVKGSGGKVVTIPSDVTAAGLFVNKSLFDKAGVAIPSDPGSTWTWDEFLAAADKVREATGAKYDLTFDASASRLRAFTYEFGGNFIHRGSNGKYSANDKTITALKKFASMNDDTTMPKSVWTSGADPNALFKSGQVVAYWSGVWQVADFATSITNFQWASAPAPAQPVHATDVNTGGNMVAFKNSDSRGAAAKKFLDFMFAPANYTKLTQTNGYLPVESGLSATYPFKQQQALDAFALYNKEIAIADPISTSSYGDSVRLSLAGKAIATDPTKDEMGKVINGQEDVPAAVKTIVAAYDQQVGG